MKYLLVVVLAAVCIACNSGEKKTVNETPTDTIVDTVEVDSFKLLSERIQKNPDIAMNWVQRGDYFFKLGNLNDARLDYEQAVVLDSLNADYRVKYGNVLIGFLELQGAKYNFEHALKHDSLNADAYVGLGKVYAFIDNPGMATVFLNKAYKVNPYLPEAYLLEGLIYREDYEQTKRPESWKRAKSSFQTAIEQNPEYYDAYIMLGDMNGAEGKDMEALDYYSSAIQILPERVEGWYKKGMQYQTNEKYEQARYCYRKIHAIDSTYTDAYYNQGFLHLEKEPKNFDSAMYYYRKLIEIDSLYFKAYNDIGLILEYNDEIDSAIYNYKKALEINPDFEMAKKNLKIAKRKKS